MTLPRSLRITRVLLYTFAGITLLAVVAALFWADLNAETLGALTWVALPGLLALVCALRLRSGGRSLFWIVLALQLLIIVQALGNLGAADPRGVTQLLFPVAILVCVLLRPSRQHLLDR